MTSFVPLSIGIIIILVTTPIKVYAINHHDEVCKKTTLFSFTYPPQKESNVVLCHPVGKALAATNNANIQFNQGVTDAQKNTNQTKCPTGHTKNYCQGFVFASKGFK